ncbi:MAG TPA: Spy/CpxP family protein refolding chaperone [Rhodothermales bacterium]|nr:Spy/CpxP family protein refolding chaperone [Rhodothermales bacterium]
MKTKSLLSLFAMALLLVVWIAAPAAAQRGPHERRANPEQRIERHVRMLDRQVDLSDAQEAELKTLLQAQHAERRTWLDANEDASREDKRAYFEAQAEATKAAIASVLTTEQQQTLEEKIAERGEKGRFRRGQRGAMRGKRGPARLAEKLDLTEAQQAQLKELHTGHRDAMQAWMDSSPNATQEEKRAYRKEQAEAHRSALESILTPEQKQMLEEAKSTRDRRGRGHMRHGRRGPRGFAGLDLTDVQRSQLQDLRQAHREAMKAWMDASPNATQEEKRAYRKEQAEAHRSALESILTPEQKQILEERRAEWQDRRGRRKGASDGSSEKTGSINLNDGSSPDRFGLSNYPNPFNPSTEIRFDLPEASHVSLVVYDVQGREISTLVDEQLGAGEHTATFNAANLPTGTYLYRLTVGSVTQTGRMVLMK